MTNGYGQTKSFLGAFKDFIMRGNVLDLAVAVVIGTAFGKITTSLVENIVMPIISLAIPGGQWRNVKIVLGTIADPKDPSKKIENAILLGQFLGTIVDFILIAFVIFLVVRVAEAAKLRTKRQKALAEVALDPMIVTQENLIQSLERLTHAVESQVR